MIRLLLRLWPLIFLYAGYTSYKQYTTWVEETRVPLENSIEGKKGKLTSIKADIGRAKEFQRTRDEKLAQLRALGEQLDGMTGRMPRSSNIPELLRSLADVADKAGIEFRSFKPQPTKKQEFLVVTPIDVKLTGSYVQVMSFLDAAAHLTRIVSSEKLKFNLSAGAPKTGVSRVSADITLVTYHLDESIPPPQNPPAGSGKTGG